MLLPEASATDTDFWPRVLVGAQAGARNRETSLILAVVSNEEEANLRLPSHLDGIHIAGFLLSDRLTLSYISFVRQTGHPAVCTDTYLPDLALDGVMADDAEGARTAVRHLVDMGHEKIGFIGNIQWASSFQQRWTGFRGALEEAGLEVRPEWTVLRKGSGLPWEPTWIREQLHALNEMPTAWFCTNDLTAFAVMKVLGEMGLRVPEDVSVIGFDNVARAATEATPLTTVHFPMEVMGRRCVERLYQRMENPDDPVDLTLISTRLVVRESVKALRAREAVPAVK
ncbi:MAG: substrate-binding domain-containing protein [Bacillota bacterium]